MRINYDSPINNLLALGKNGALYLVTNLKLAISYDGRPLNYSIVAELSEISFKLLVAFAQLHNQHLLRRMHPWKPTMSWNRPSLSDTPEEETYDDRSLSPAWVRYHRAVMRIWCQFCFWCQA